MDHAPRRAVPRFLSALARTAVPTALLASLALTGFAAPALADPAPAATADRPTVADAAPVPRTASSNRAEEAPDGVVTIGLAPDGGGTWSPGTDLGLSLLVVNRTDTALPAGQAVVSMDRRTLDTRAALNAWLTPDPGGDLPGETLVTVAVPLVPVGGHVVVQATAPAATVPSDGEFAPHGLAAVYQGAQARSTVVVDGVVDTAITRVGVVVPIVPPETTSPLVDAEELTRLTGPGGDLTRLLDAVEGTSATLAIDPRLLVSIRVLGDTAPASATAWLDRLERLPNQSFELPYADADLVLEHQSGLESPLPPPTFDHAVDPSALTTPTPTSSATAESSAGSPTPTASATATPSPTETEPAEPPVPPTYEELTAFPYTIPSVSWPTSNTLSAADLPFIAQTGARQLVLDGGNVELTEDSSFTPDAATIANGWNALVMDSQLTDAVRTASTSSAESDWNAATATAEAILAVVSREQPSDQRTLLTTTGRAAATDPAQLGRTLRQLDGLSWTDLTPAEFPQAPAAGEDPPAGVVSASITDRRFEDPALERMRALSDASAHADGFSTIYADPDAVRAKNRASLLGAASAGWHERLDDWFAASQGLLDYVFSTEASVAINETSAIQLVGRETELPVFVRNDGPEPVTVQVALRPMTGKIEAGEPVTITIPPGSMERAMLPVTAITNGLTKASVALLTPDGVPLMSHVEIDVNVQAEWETVGVVVFSVGLVLLFVAGVVRTIRKRRRERVGASLGGDDAGTTEE